MICGRSGWCGVPAVRFVESPVMIDRIVRTVITFNQENNVVVQVKQNVK
jgi:hypothetical protein